MNYDRNTIEWGSADGTKRLVKDLSDRHVVNIINWITVQGRRKELIEFFEEEAKLRAYWAFCENKPIPTKMEDGTWGFTNIRWWERIYNRAKLLYYNRIAKRKQNQQFKEVRKLLQKNGKLLKNKDL